MYPARKSISTPHRPATPSARLADDRLEARDGTTESTDTLLVRRVLASAMVNIADDQIEASSS
jgi:hypothetical protein